MLAYMYTRPGKKLLFMGTEIAPYSEWNHDTSLDWHLADDPSHAAFLRFVQELGALYDATPALWRDDFVPAGFSWIDVADRMNSVLSYVRHAGDAHVVVVLNMTPETRSNYRVGVPAAGTYRVLLSSDAQRFGGSGYGSEGDVRTDASPFHGHPQSLSLSLPPLGALVLAPG
jgi:1,4-alpha-glucan branching enzyme